VDGHWDDDLGFWVDGQVCDRANGFTCEDRNPGAMKGNSARMKQDAPMNQRRKEQQQAYPGRNKTFRNDVFGGGESDEWRQAAFL
jgi:hypothetical protein